MSKEKAMKREEPLARYDLLPIEFTTFSMEVDINVLIPLDQENIINEIHIALSHWVYSEALAYSLTLAEVVYNKNKFLAKAMATGNYYYVHGTKLIAETLHEGALKYKPRNWEKGYSRDSLLNHAMNHFTLHLLGDKSEPHLAHAITNVMFMYVLDCRGKFT